MSPNALNRALLKKNLVIVRVLLCELYEVIFKMAFGKLFFGISSGKHLF
jgi:hypothetical protein